jgi:hypothetical protein
MDIDWDDLRVFLAVARAESLSGAGRALRSSTPRRWGGGSRGSRSGWGRAFRQVARRAMR